MDGGGATVGGSRDTDSHFSLGASLLSGVPCIGCDLVGYLQQEHFLLSGVHLLLVVGLKILQLLCLASCGLDVASDLLSSHGISSDSNSYSFCDCLDGLQRQGVCVAHSMCTGFWTVLGNVPQLVTVVTGPRVLGLHMIQVHGLQVCSQLAAGGGGHG